MFGLTIESALATHKSQRPTKGLALPLDFLQKLLFLSTNPTTSLAFFGCGGQLFHEITHHAID